MELILCIIAKINSILKPTSFEVVIINQRSWYLDVKHYLIETIDFLYNNWEEIQLQLKSQKV